MKQRSDYGCKADEYFNGLDEAIRPLAMDLRTLIVEALPDSTESIKWGFPVYEQNGLVCSIRDSKNCVVLQFFIAGISFSDLDGLLEGPGEKMRHVKIRMKSDIKKRLHTLWIKQAAKLNT